MNVEHAARVSMTQEHASRVCHGVDLEHAARVSMTQDTRAACATVLTWNTRPACR
jgi:hypothetical protein